MAVRSRITPEQLDKIRSTLSQSLGEESGDILQSLERRYSGDGNAQGAVDMGDEGDEDSPKRPALSGPGKVNVARLVQEGKVEEILTAIGQVREDREAVRHLAVAVIKQGKAFHMVEALSKIKGDEELVNALVDGIVSKTGINPVIDALRHAGESTTAIRKLAANVAEQGTVNHIIRAIATVHKQPEAEMIWAMEIIGRGTVEQMLEAMNLIDKESPGCVVLATGVVSSKETTIEQLVRALTAVKDSPKSATILAVELAKRAEPTALVTLLEKYVSDATDAGEIVVCKLVQHGRAAQMVDACKHISSNTQAGRILAAGIIKRATPEQMEKAYRMLASNPPARKMIALEIVKRKGRLMALRVLGSEVWDLVKNQEEIESFARKAQKRYEWLLQNELGGGEGGPPQKPAQA